METAAAISTREGSTPSNDANIIQRIKRRLLRYRALILFNLVGDGVATRCKNLAFLSEPEFLRAWQRTEEWCAPAYGGRVPDIRWRAHFALWCAKNASRLDGDFAECGVHSGLLSAALTSSIDFAGSGKRLFLFDTFAGIPTDALAGAALDKARLANTAYRDVWGLVSSTFGKLPYVRLIRGELPATLDGCGIDKLCYLSIDLNVASYEMQVIERLWEKLVPGAYVLLDDYAFDGHEDQHRAWNDFAAKHGRAILTFPTGQGLLIR